MRKLIKSIKYAIMGVILCIRNERNFRIHIVAALAVLHISPLYNFTHVETITLALTVFSVLITEMFNTSIENLVNLVTKEYHDVAKLVKDLSAGAVGLTAMCSLVVGYFLLIRDRNLTEIYAPLVTTWKIYPTILLLALGMVFIFLPNKKGLLK